MKKIMGFLAIIAGFLFLLAPSASAATHVLTPSSTWDFSESRTAGHHAFADGVLHAWTDDATSLAKVAGYTPVSETLAHVAAYPDPTLTWVGTTPAPGFQLAITYGGNHAYLVGESVYGDKWWISDSGCGTWCDGLSPAPAFVGGGGSAHSATLDEWVHGMPEAVVTKIGFSLGSGVKGDGSLTKMTFAGDVYTFDADPVVVVPPPTTTTTTSSSTPTSTTAPGTSTSSTSSTPGQTIVDRYNCGDFPLANGDTAQMVLNHDRTDPNRLDADHDGVACEANEPNVDQVIAPVTTTTSSTPGHQVARVPAGGVHAGDGSTVESLAFTGSKFNMVVFLGIGVAFIIAGVATVFIARRRYVRR